MKYYILSICLKLGYKFASCIGFENEYDLNQQKLIFNDITGKAEALTNWCQSSQIDKKKTSNAKEKKLFTQAICRTVSREYVKVLQTVDELTYRFLWFRLSFLMAAREVK